CFLWDLPPPRSCFSIICSEDEECQMNGFFPICVKKPLGICWAMGDPHYCTFDQRYFDFMGTCTYVVTRNCHENNSLPAFEVLAKNENRGDISVSYVARVTVNIGDITISVGSSEPGKVRIDQSLWSLPVVLDDVGVSMFQSGSFITILFNFGLSVQYDWDHFLMVSLPTPFINKVCGLCGNFNGDPNDDFTMPSNTLAPSVTTFGQSWKVHNLTLDEGCRDDKGGPGCDAQALRQWLGEKYCGLLMMAPFSQCHSVIDPSIYTQNCMYDVCMTDGQRNYLCKVLEVYASVCQRVGIQLTNWREVANCSYRCPENSHYEFCGSACPLTCMGLKSPLNCTLPCVETCTCDPGFVLSGSKCVPSTQCGCSYNGHYIPAGETFWADDACQRLCRCSTEGGHLECQDGGCGTGQHCQVENGIRGCYPVSQSTCLALGDPHYYTFDGNYFDFQGNCVYQLVGVCISYPGLVPFDVLVQNEFRGSRVVTFTKLLQIIVYNLTIVIDREYSGSVTVNGELLNLPLHLIEGQVSVFRSGWSAVVQTSFGLKVTFDWNSFATVTVPSTYMGAICGLCGNYNGNPEDDLTVRETALPASGPMEFGASWSVAKIPDCVHGCTENCQDCDPTRRSVYETSDFCGLLRDPQGPFKDCQTVLDSTPFFEDCVYDVCLYNGRRDLLCQAITAYVTACQAMGRTINPWRTAEFCGVQCPVHSHYELCGSGCEVTCHSLAPPAGCRGPCMEGCVCDKGYIRSGDRCVPFSQCGCLYGNRYYLLYQQFYPGNNCEEVCMCLPDGQVFCNRSSCGPYERCELVDGVHRCQPIRQAICEASGDPHYVSFDGLRFDFQGTCTYILSQSCGLERTNLTHFSILVENERWWPNRYHRVSVTQQVALTVYGSTIILRQNEPQILVNGVLTNLPYSSGSLNGSLVQAYKEGIYYIIKTGFGLHVTYDLLYYVTVTIPDNYRNKTCGLCGNFDGVPSNDFRLPDGNITHDVNVFGGAWKVDVPGAVCEDGCEGDTCLDCDPRLKAIFEKPPYCGVLVDPSGPFAACHAVLNPSAYLNDCVFDTCASSGSIRVVCDSVARYAFSCLRAGVVIQRWRTDNFCPMSCPAHSHYEPCTDVCSSACPGLTTIIQCPKTCTEGCACDDGYLFDGQQCTERQQCGCYQQGRTYKAGEVVYLDQCQQKCQCDPVKGFTCERANCPNGTQCFLRAGMWGCFYPDPCQDLHCREKETCRFERGNAVCVPQYNSTCWAWGDPHYHTFDGYEYDFQGTCKYVLSKTCGNLSGLVPFSVTQSNENRGSPDVSYVREVEVTVYGSTFIMVNHHTGQIMVDGLWFYLPLDHHDGRVRVRQSGNAALLETNFGLRVSFIWGWRVDLQLPSSYYGVVCGLCGNFNGNGGDERRDPAGILLPSLYQWAKSWRAEDSVTSACHVGCETDCPVCSPDLHALYETDTFCGVLTSTGQSVFSACHAKVNPQAFQQSCVYDLCFNNGDRRLLCQALETYVDLCRQEGVIIKDWRGRLNCSMSCPPNSHYEACASPCPATCPYPNQQPNCTDTCVEACVCDSGFVLSAGTCVPTNQCGCFYEGAYYQQGQTFWADEQCHRLCECDRNLSAVVCRESSCAVGESCSIVNGSRSCQPVTICEASGDPHYVSFDGLRFDFQGTCTYILSQSCGLERTNLTHFSILVENERWWPNRYHRVSVTQQVALTVYGSTIILRQNEPQILVNGVLTNLPYSSSSLNGSLVQAYKEGIYYIIKTGFGLYVTYDLLYYVTVTIPDNYRNKTCGLCGNFDGVPSNDFRLPDGNITQDVNVFGRAWKVDVPGAVCEDGCEGDTCLDCDPRLKAIFEKPPYCGVLVDPSGPFAACHAVLNPSAYLNDCVFDTCASSGSIRVVCDSVARYAFSCLRAGVVIQRWRTDNFCPMSCPAHSHYEPCTDVCSSACPGLTTIIQCPKTCTEGCACDDGYLFDGQQCTEHQQCGCYQQGRTYKHSFFSCPVCDRKCQCDPVKGFTCERANCPNETCRFERGNAVCVPQYNSTCWAWGDPHYHTFDGYEYDFQGTCKYVLSKTCGNLSGLVPFSVTQSNENRGNPDVSYVREVEVTVDGLWFYLPHDHHDGRVRVRQSGNAALLETNFGLRVSFIWGWRIDLHLPSSYYGVVCGLCGNFNGNGGDERRDPAGILLPSLYQWAKSWRAEDSVTSACHVGCETDCPVCPPDLHALYETDTFCGVLTSTGQSVFSACHAKVNPQAFQQSCVYDLCFNNGDRRLLCQALETYVDLCRQEGVIIKDWRGRLNCSMSCPPNSHYEACASPCPATCPYPNQQPNCTDTCVEACVCDSGFVLSAGTCVPTNQCGCFYEGAYYQQGQTFWADEQCHRLCECDRNLSAVVCRESSCAVGESCSIVNGSRRCQPVSRSAICTGSVDPHYRTFDGFHFDFQGTCVYQLAALCLHNASLVPFNVTVKNDHRWSSAVSFTNTVNVTVNGFTITLTREHPIISVVRFPDKRL
uniref:VWFD domain-containing protein n=1 Tax=Cyprinus carpio carpio TaxID=630221 RepID=A0A8C1ECA5_CYPCA